MGIQIERDENMQTSNSVDNLNRNLERFEGKTVKVMARTKDDNGLLVIIFEGTKENLIIETDKVMIGEYSIGSKHA